MKFFPACFKQILLRDGFFGIKIIFSKTDADVSTVDLCGCVMLCVIALYFVLSLRISWIPLHKVVYTDRDSITLGGTSIYRQGFHYTGWYKYIQTGIPLHWVVQVYTDSNDKLITICLSVLRQVPVKDIGISNGL
jgi:uncharacterized protein (UPF0248 family)